MTKAVIVRLGIIFLLIIGVALLFTLRDKVNADAVVVWLRGFGDASPLLFVGIYIVATVLFLPGGLLTLVGGAMFGTIPGALYSLTGATVGATLAFLIARYVASGWVAARLHAKLPTMMREIESGGWKFVGMVRLVPIIPFNALNYALGLTPIRVSHYVWASFVFMLPGALAYSYLGHIGREAAAGRADLIRTVLIAVGVISVMSLLAMFIKGFRQVQTPIPEINAIDAVGLNQSLDSNPVGVIDVRSSDEFSAPTGHIKGAINVPLPSLTERVHELDAYRKRKVVVVCLSAKRSTQAIYILREAGFEDLVVLRGGTKEWAANHLPVAVGC